MRLSILIGALALCAGAEYALAQVPASTQGTPAPTQGNDATYQASQGGGAIPALPLHEHMSGDVKYLSGGIGDEEEAQLKSVANDYNMHLLLTAPGGAFVSEATVHVTAKDGTDVLTVDNAGPYVFAQLKPGSYVLTATNRHGENEQWKFTLGDKGSAKQQITFKESSEGDITPHTPTATLD